MQLTSKAEHLARSNEGRVYTKSSSAEFHRANKVTVYVSFIQAKWILQLPVALNAPNKAPKVIL